LLFWWVDFFWPDGRRRHACGIRDKVCAVRRLQNRVPLVAHPC
jgi:hypothetical protein